MIDTALFEKLKNYLTEEFMTLSEKRNEMLSEKVKLEVMKKQEESQLFENANSLRIKRLFSPLEEEVFEKKDFSSLREHKITQKIQNIESELNKTEVSMKEVKEYLFFVQMLENNKQQEEEEKKTIENSPYLSFIIKEMLSFLQARYPDTEFLFDFNDNHTETEEELNRYFIQVLTYTISASIESFAADTVIIEGEVRDKKILVNLQMLLENDIIDQYSYQYEIELKK